VGTGDIVKAKGPYDEVEEFIKAKKIDLVLRSGVVPPPVQVNSITVNVNYSGSVSVGGSPVYVTSFTADDDEIETKSGTMSENPMGGYSSTIVLDNNGAGYMDGTYSVRAHIDRNRDGVLTDETDNDFITLGEFTVSNVSTSVTLNGPWGSFFTFAVYNFSAPFGTDGKIMYVTVVSSGDYWGNYSYGEFAKELPAGVIGIAGWGPDGLYDFYACIDMNDNMDVIGGPDNGDYVASNLNVELKDGVFPDQTVFPWSVY